MALKIGISRSNFISSSSEDFTVFFYVIWWTEYKKNHWGILDLENLQSRSHFIFCISESWRWLSSVIDALKMGKTVKKKPQSIFDLEIEIFKVMGVCGNFFTNFYIFSASNYIRKPSKNLAYIRNKIWPWISDFLGQGCLREFFTIFFIFSAWNYIEIPSQTFMANETNFLHCTLRCLRGWSIYIWSI